MTLKSTLLQTLLISAIVLLFVGFDIILFNQQKEIEERLESQSIIIFSTNTDLLHNLLLELKASGLLKQIEFESSQAILNRIIAEHNLMIIEELIDSQLLPSLLEFNLDADRADEQSLKKILSILAEHSDDLTVNLNKADFETDIQAQTALKNYRTFLRYLAVAMIFFSVFILKRSHIVRERAIWRVYRLSGGKKNPFGCYLNQAIFSALFPITLLLVMMYILEIKGYQIYYLDIKQLVSIFGLVLSASLAASIKR